MKPFIPLMGLLLLAGCTTALSVTATQPPTTFIPSQTPITPTLHAEASPSTAATASPSPLTPSGEIFLDLLAAQSGATYGIAVAETTVFLGAGTHLLAIDASHPAAPELIAQSPEFPGVVHALIVREKIAYVAAGTVICTVDIADPARVKITGSVTVPGTPLVLALRDNVLYAGGTGPLTDDLFSLFEPFSAHGGMVAAIDVSKPSQPVLLDDVTTREPVVALALTGATLIANDALIDVNDPGELGEPQQAHVLDFYPLPWSSLTVMGDTLIIGRQHMINGWDIADPTHPQIKFKASLLDEEQDPTAFGYPVAVSIDGSMAYVLADYEGHGSIGSLRLPETVEGRTDYLVSSRLVRAGDLLYVTKNGLYIYEVRHPLRAPIGVFEVDAPVDVGIDAGAAYVLSADSRFTVPQSIPPYAEDRGKLVSLSLPDLKPLDTYTPEHIGYLGNFSLFDQQLYLDEQAIVGAVSSFGLHVFDASNPADLRLIRKVGAADGLPLNHSVYQVKDPVVVDYYTIRAILPAQESEPEGFLVFDLRVPGYPPREVSTRYHLMTIEDANSQFVFATFPAPNDNVNKLMLINVGDWSVSEKSVDIPGYIVDVAAMDDYAVVGTVDGLVLISTTDPGNPHIADEVALPDTPYEIALEGDHVFVTSRGTVTQGRLYAFVLDDARLRLAATFDLPAGRAHLGAQPGWVIVGNQEMGVYLIRTE